VEDDAGFLPREREVSAARIAIFVAAIAFCLTPWASPPIALAIGLTIALTIGQPLPRQTTSRATKILLQASVVGLGFGANLHSVIEAGREGILFTIATIAGTLVLGYFIGRALGVERTTAHLISSGTAICGGSAIAAVGPVLGATDEEMSVSLGTIFILNSIALFIFPPIGHALAMTQQQFGIWSAIAIHDTSSVVGAAARFGQDALRIATTVKLTRALWIVPLTLVTATFRNRLSGAPAPVGQTAGGGAGASPVPWFIGFYVIASVLRTYAPLPPSLFDVMVMLARIGLTVTLFLIGAGLSRKAIAAVGARPLILGVILWIAISCVSVWSVLTLVR
jgi:uncharacterized integral membrane protein (TIGR00698 family)